LRRPSGRLFFFVLFVFFVETRRRGDCGGDQFKVNPVSLNWSLGMFVAREKFNWPGTPKRNRTDR
jgi:hypothetical protein